MIVEIKGVQFVNKGAALMLMAVLDQLRRRWPTAEIALEPGLRSPYAKRAQLGAFQKCSARWFVGNIRVDLNRLLYSVPHAIRSYFSGRWGIVTEQDIDVVLDASGFAYGDQWPSVRTRQLAGELARYHRAGKPYILLPQAFGPFTRSRDRHSLRRSLSFATLVAARDRDSFRHLEGLFHETPANICQYPDLTTLIAGVVPDWFSPTDRILIIPNSHMLSTRALNKLWPDRYLELLQHAIAAIRDLGFVPAVLNHEGGDDRAICETLIAANDGEIELINEDDPLRVKGIIGSVKAVISSRFHGCVSALCQGVPCLGTSWSHKYDRLFEDYSRSEFLLTPTMDRAALTRLLRSAMDRVADHDYLSSIEAEKRKAEILWTDLNHKLSRVFA